MQVILLERVNKLGQMGETVKVKDGYARNYLLPLGKALRANDANKKRFETERATLEARNLERKSEAQKIADKLEGKTFVMVRSAGETGQLYGSVAARDVVEALANDGYIVQRNQVDLADPIKSVGVHTVPLILHAEVAVTITVNVARSADEATRQAQGEDVTVHTFEADDDGDFAAGQKDAAADDRFEE